LTVSASPRSTMENRKLQDTIDNLSMMDYIYDSIEQMNGENDDIFQRVSDLAMEITRGKGCLLALIDGGKERCRFRVVGGSGETQRHTAPVRPPLDTLFRDVVQDRKALLAGADEGFPDSVICAPLMIRRQVFGVLSLSGTRDGDAFTRKELRYLSALAKRASLNMENKILYESVYSNITDIFQSLVASIHHRDHYTKRHSSNVTETAVKTAEALNCTRDEIESIRRASMLHDIGKIAIPDRILLKEGRLTDEEYTVIKEHPAIGGEILKAVTLMDAERDIILHHHERWDGTGYPDGLTGKEIPRLSRILSVADAFDAMITDRPYRDALSVDVAIDELYKNTDSQFDKDVVGIFVSAYCGTC